MFRHAGATTRGVSKVEVRKNVSLEFVRSLLEEGKPFNVIMQEIMVLGSKLAKEHGHKDYASAEDFFAAIKAGESPLLHIDGDVDTDIEGAGTNLIAVKSCPLKDLMAQMSESKTSDAKVNTVLDGHHLREGEDSNYVDIGCYIVQQLRQMMISSISVNGKYDLNYIHLACDKGTGTRSISKEDVALVKIDKEFLDRILDEYDCIYTISFKEGQE